MDGIRLKISGTLTGPLEELKEELPNAERRALYRAAYFLRDKIRQSLISSLPKCFMTVKELIECFIFQKASK